MKIPTKNDFISNRQDAFSNLHNYIQNLFPNKNEDSLSAFEIKLLEGTLLTSFFDEFGEIVGNEKAFYLFCEEHIDKQVKDFSYSTQSLDNDFNENNLENYGKEDLYNDLEDDVSTKKLDIFDKLLKHIKTLPEKEQAKFKVAFISIQNTLDINAKNAPTDMPVSVREEIHNIAGKSKMGYYNKRSLLEEKLYSSGFWQYYHNVMGNELLAKDSSKQREIYRKYYRQAKFSNPTRDKEKMASIVNILSNTNDNFKEPIINDIKNFLLRKTLKDIPKEANTPRDNALKGFKNAVCQEYLETIAIYLKHQLDKNFKTLLNSKIESDINRYLEHRRTCQKCRAYEEKLSKAMTYRIDRLKEKLSNLGTSPYCYHCPTEEKIELTREKDLVRYYEREYRHNPCDLNYYYLILSYKIAGLEDKAKQLLNETKNIPEYKNIQKTKIATQIKGD